MVGAKTSLLLLNCSKMPLFFGSAEDDAILNTGFVKGMGTVFFRSPMTENRTVNALSLMMGSSRITDGVLEAMQFKKLMFSYESPNNSTDSLGEWKQSGNYEKFHHIRGKCLMET